MAKYVLISLIFLFLYSCSPVVVNLVKRQEYSPLDADSLYMKEKPKIFENLEKGTWDLRLSYPYINFFKLKPDGEETVSSNGFMGISIGIDYYHQRNQYLSILAASVTDFYLPFQFVPVIGEREVCLSKFMGLTNNHRYKFLTVGYGLSYSRNSWKHIYDDDNNGNRPPNKEYADNMLGLMFTTYWLPTNSFCVGFIYRPNFVRLNPTSLFKYEQLISIDFAWRIRLRTAK